MKASTLIKQSLLLAGFFAALTIARAAGDSITITGVAKCAEHDLKVQPRCQTVVLVKDAYGTTEYYIKTTEYAKSFHQLICQHPHMMTVTGTVTEKNGRLELLATNLEVGAAIVTPAPAPATRRTVTSSR
jgi:hypothetical protein